MISIMESILVAFDGGMGVEAMKLGLQQWHVRPARRKPRLDAGLGATSAATLADAEEFEGNRISGRPQGQEQLLGVCRGYFVIGIIPQQHNMERPLPFP